MLELKKKACHLGKSMAINTEHHGEDDVGAVDIQIDGIMLNAKEIDLLLGNEAHQALYIYPPPRADESTMPSVRFDNMLPLGLSQKFEKARVTLHVGMEPTKLVFADCKISSIKLEPKEGGLTQMKCGIRARPESEEVATLFDYRNTSATLWISNAERVTAKNENQGELGLGEKDGGEEGEGAGASMH